MDVCGDREDPLPGIDGRLVSDAVRPGTAHVTYEPDWDEAAPTVAAIARPGDLVITVGLRRRDQGGPASSWPNSSRPNRIGPPSSDPARQQGR